MSTAHPQPPPTFVQAMADAAEAAVRQRIPVREAVGRAAFALDAEYAAAGLPTSTDPESETADEQVA